MSANKDRTSWMFYTIDDAMEDYPPGQELDDDKHMEYWDRQYRNLCLQAEQAGVEYGWAGMVWMMRQGHTRDEIVDWLRTAVRDSLIGGFTNTFEITTFYRRGLARGTRDALRQLQCFDFDQIASMYRTEEEN